jgi:hypothetical protein
MQRRYRRSARLCNARAGPCQVSNRPGREPRGSTPGAQASARRAAGTRSRRAGEATGAKGCGVPQLRAGRAERQRKTVKAAAPIGGGIIGSVDDTHAPLVPTTPTRDTRTARVPATARAPSRASCRLPSCTARSAHCPLLRRFTPFGFSPIEYRFRSLPDPVAAAPPHATSLRLGCPAQVYLAGRGRESAAQGADSLPRKPMRRAESRREAGRRRVGPLGPTPTDQRLETNTQKPTPRSDGAPVRGPVARDTRAQFTRLRAAIASQEGPPRTSWIRLPRPGIPGFGDDPVHSV